MKVFAKYLVYFTTYIYYITLFSFLLYILFYILYIYSPQFSNRFLGTNLSATIADVWYRVASILANCLAQFCIIFTSSFLHRHWTALGMELDSRTLINIIVDGIILYFLCLSLFLHYIVIWNGFIWGIFHFCMDLMVYLFNLNTYVFISALFYHTLIP